MRLTAILLTVACISAGARGHSQGVTLSLKNAPLEKVFAAIEKQAGYYFTYTKEQLQGTKPVDVEVQSADIKTVMDICVKNQPVGYELIGKAVVIKRRTGRFTDLDGIAQEEVGRLPIDVKGRVVNENGEPVAGVTVTVRGTNKSTATNSNGEFTISGVNVNDVLVFTSVNMEPFEIKVDGRSEYNINLKTKVSTLEGVEVRVNTGYQQVTKERFVGSVVTIDSALFNRTITTDILSRLEGIAPGVLFFGKSTGQPRIQIRGLSTIGQSGVSSEPLIIVDNFPYYDDLNNINPNDIENVTVLKDAAAASVWGSKAGNGVIVITTKKGRYNKPFQLNVSSSFRVQEKPNLFYYPQMNSSDFIDVEQFLFSKGFYDGDLSNTISWPVISPVVEILAQKRAGLLSAYEADAKINSLRSLDVRNDYENFVNRPAASWQNYVNFNGGTNVLRYALSLGFDNNQNNIRNGGGYDRYSINSTTSFKPFRALELTLGLGVTHGETTNGGVIEYPLSAGGGKGVLYPYAQLADAYGNSLPVVKNLRTAFLDTIGSGRLLDWQYRPLDELHLNSSSQKDLGIRLNLGATVKFTSWLDGSVQWGYNRQNQAGRGYSSPEAYSVRDLINRYTQLNGATVVRPIPLGGILGVSNGENITNNLRGQLNFNKSFSSKHNVTAFVAGEVGENNSSSNANRYYGYNDDLLSYSTAIDYVTLFPQLIGGGTSRIPAGSSYSEGLVNRTVSLLGNISYSFLDRYRLYASARKDGANIFGVNTNNKWKPLWSVGASWDISKEGFYHVYWMNLLRLRASYGYTGNASTRISAITTLRELGGGNSPYTQLPMFTVNNPPNPDLRWEKVGILNLGVDFSLFKDRISGTIEWFKKTSQDVLATAPIDPITGLRSVTYNYANLSGTGFEISLNTKNINRKDFQWQTAFNFSHVKTIVTKYHGGYVTTPTSDGINPKEGELAYAVYSYKWMGLDPATGDPQGFLNGHVSKDYQSILVDSFQNQVFHGSSLPLYFGNLLNSFSFKGFSVSFNITYRFDYYFRKSALSYSGLYRGWNGHFEFANRWQQPGDEVRTSVPSMVYPVDGLRDNFYSAASINVERGDNIRLENIRLGLPAWENRRANGFPIRSIQLSFIPANLNLFIWRASKSGLDPDYSGNAYALPPAKVWAVALNVTFK